MKILVGSKNPTKLDAVKESFAMYYNDDLEVTGISVDSDISDQPLGNETFEGANNRAKALEKINKEQNLRADFFVGIEGGVIEFDDKNFNSNMACVISKDGKVGFGVSPVYQLPNSVKDKLIQGIELGTVIDEITSQKKSGYKDGAIDFFSKGKINRKEMTKLALIMALIPIINEKLY